MKTRIGLLACAAGIAGLGIGQAQAGVITQWGFTSSVASPDNTVSATTGTGTGTQLGMTNNYTYSNGEGPGSVANCDITSTAGTAHPTYTDFAWRIRGNSNAANAGPGKANGWNNSAPNYTQGAQFITSTAGEQGITLSFDWYSTTSGVGNLQVQYTTDGLNYVNVGSDFVASSNDYYGTPTSGPTNTLVLPAGANNNPNFGVRLVSVKPVLGDSNYSVTNGDGAYASADGTGDYNNNSGNWRFGNVTISGSPVPEPTSLGLISLGSLSLLRRRRQA